MPVTLGVNDTKTINNKPTISQVVFAVNWEDTKNTPKDLIIDAMMFGLDSDNKCNHQNDVYLFLNPKLETERDLIIEHKTMDNIIDNGGILGRDKEQFFLLLDEIPQRYKKLLFAISVFRNEAEGHGLNHNLSQVSNIKPHIFNMETKDQLMKHGDYGNDFFFKETCMILGTLERQDDFWVYTNISQAFLGDISTLLGIYLREEE